MKVPRAHGFTLIEVLVAMFVMAMVAMMAWQGVDGIVRTRDASQGRLEHVLRLNTVLAQFEQDLASLQDSGVFTDPQPGFDGISMKFTRRTPTGLQLVVWSLRGGTWMRWAGPAVTTVNALQDNWISSQQFIGNETGQVRLLTGISDWQCYAYRSNAWRNCQSSAGSDGTTVTAVPAAGAASVPMAALDPLKGVRIVLTFEEGSGYTGTLTREIALGPQ
jgi:general secretion pathway protein J